MNKTQEKRLLKLADFVESVSPKKFDLETIGRREPCGTVCCAVGYMPVVFPRNFKYNQYNNGYGLTHWLVVESKKNDLSDMSAAEDFFGLNWNESKYLFVSESYGSRKGPKTVAKRIRDFVTKKKLESKHAKIYQTANARLDEALNINRIPLA